MIRTVIVMDWDPVTGIVDTTTHSGHRAMDDFSIRTTEGGPLMALQELKGQFMDGDSRIAMIAALDADDDD